MNPIVDSHLHIWSDDPSQYPWHPISGADPPNVPGSAEALMRVMDDHDIRTAVAVQSRVYGYDHRYVVDSMRRYPDRIVGVAIVDHTSNVTRQIRALVESGFVGLRADALGSGSRWRVTNSVRELWRTAAAEGMPIELLIGSDQLESLSPLMSLRSELPVVVEHLGIWGDGSTGDIEPVLRMSRWPNVRVKVTLAGISNDPPPYLAMHGAVRRVRDAFGAQRMMWGSDMPWRGADTYGPSLDAVRKHMPFLDEDELSWILGRTAMSVWRIT